MTCSCPAAQAIPVQLPAGRVHIRQKGSCFLWFEKNRTEAEVP